MQIACKLQCMNLSPWSMHSELFDIQGVCTMSALRGVHCTVLCVCVCVSVHQFTGALLSANMCWCCESLSGYYDDSTRLSVFLQSHLLRRLELFTFPGSGTGEGRGGAEIDVSVGTVPCCRVALLALTHTPSCNVQSTQ